MNRSYVIATLASAFVLGGCASPTYNYTPPVTQISLPAIGSVTTAQVGDTLVSQGSIIQHDAIQVDSDTNLGLFNSYTITKGIFLKLGQNGKIGYYSIRNQFEGGGTIEKSALSDPPKAVQAYTDENKICGVSVFNAYLCSTDSSYKFIKRPITSPNSFQQSLIYSGKFGNRIKFGYREFSGDTARPAFNNDVEYDLSESNIIGYKGARIEVLEATNETIRFRLISNFNTIR